MRKDIIIDHAKISWILDHCQILHLGLSNKNGSYIVPVHYGYQEDLDGKYTIYIHGTGDGEKATALDKGESIGFEIDHENLIYTPPRKGDFGPSFMSVIGNGVPRKLTDPQKKLFALRTIIHHYVNTIPVAISTEDVKNVSTWAIEVESITGRVHNSTKKQSVALGIPVEERHGKHYEDGAVVSDDFDYSKLDDETKPDAESRASHKEQKKTNSSMRKISRCFFSINLLHYQIYDLFCRTIEIGRAHV